MGEIIAKNLNLDKSDWKRVKFGEVVFEPKENTNRLGLEGLEHVVGLEHIDTENIHLRRSKGMEDDTTFTKIFRKGDVLFGRRRAYLKKAAQASFDGICSGDITVFRANEMLLPELLPFVVNNDKFFDFAVAHSAGGLSPRVKFRDLANYEFLLPPKDQQARLAELLWAADEVVEKLSYLKEKKLIAKRTYFKNSIQVKKNIQLSEIASISYGLGQPPKKDENGIAVIRATNISKGRISEEKILRVKESAIPKSRKIELEEGDIIVVRSGAYTGDIGYIPKKWEGAIAGYDLLVRPNRKLVNPIWLAEYLLEDKNQAYFKGESIRSAQPHLNSQQVSTSLIPKIKISIQNITAKKLSAFDKGVLGIESLVKSTQTLQKSLINQIF